MNRIEFDLTRPPMSEDELARLRTSCQIRLNGATRWLGVHVAAIALGALVGAVSMAAQVWGEAGALGGMAGPFLAALSFVVGATIGGMVVAMLLAFLPFYGRLVMEPEAQANHMLDDLVEMGYSELSEECIDFVELCRADAIVRTYQNQLAAMGRKPVNGEHKAAKAWVKSREMREIERQKQELAKQACAQLAAAI